jgi:hypothetical protein
MPCPVRILLWYLEDVRETERERRERRESEEREKKEMIYIRTTQDFLNTPTRANTEVALSWEYTTS